MAKGTVNKVILLGRLGNTPDIRTTQNGTSIATLNIATNNGNKDNIHTEWHKVIIFGKLAEVVKKYAIKGIQVFIEGRLHTNKWQNKNGNMQYTTEIIATNFQFIGSNISKIKNNYDDTSKDNIKIAEQENLPDFTEVNSYNFDDDIPF